MPLGFATLPLGPAELRALADAGYSIVDQGQRTPGLLILQAPDQASGDGGVPASAGRASEEPAAGQAQATAADLTADAADLTAANGASA